MHSCFGWNKKTSMQALGIFERTSRTRSLSWSQRSELLNPLLDLKKVPQTSTLHGNLRLDIQMNMKSLWKIMSVFSLQLCHLNQATNQHAMALVRWQLRFPTHAHWLKSWEHLSGSERPLRNLSTEFSAFRIWGMHMILCFPSINSVHEAHLYAFVTCRGIC